MELIIIAMLVLLPLLFSQNYRSIINTIFINIMMIDFYEKKIENYIEEHYTLISIIFIIGITISYITTLFAFWNGYDLRSPMIIILIAGICQIFACIQKLIIFIINIIYTDIIVRYHAGNNVGNVYP